MNANRFDESLGSGCVEARNEFEIGNFVNRENVAAVEATLSG